MIDHTLTNAEYHQHPAISKSGLDRIDQSPAHYRAWLTEKRVSTPALAFGTAAHSYILEPEIFDDGYIVMTDKIDRRTKVGKEAWETFQAEAGDRQVLTHEDFAALVAMRGNVDAHPVARELLEEGVAEASVFGELFNVAVKCRPDWLRANDGIVVDLKTTDNASPNAFARSIAKYRYAVQAALYQDILAAEGIDVKAFVFIAVEKTAPHAVGVYELDGESLEVGQIAYQRNLDTYRRCLETDHWPAYSNAVETLTLPRWAFAEAA